MAKKSFFDKPIRTYTVEGGMVYPSVTEVLKMMDKSGPLIGWAVKECGNFIMNETDNLYRAAQGGEDMFLGTLEKTVKLAKAAHRSTSQKALDIGTRAHEIAHMIGLGMPVDMSAEPEKVQNAIRAFTSWLEKSKYKGIEHEKVVWSHELEVAGTLDDIGMMGMNLTLLDYKTSKALYDEYLIQVAVYAQCYEEMTKLKVDDAWIIRFDKETGEPEEKQLTNRAKHLDCFVGLRKAWQWKQDMREE